MDDDIQEGGDPAEAFDRLRAVIEGQDRELALLRRAVEGLAAERAHIDVPDYTETLGRIQQGVDATVTICHSRTKDLAAHTRRADILIAAIGRPRFVTAAMVKPGATVIDVGINRVEEPRAKQGYILAGDVDFAAVSEVAGRITPVPGGVGPLTIAMLLKSTLVAASRVPVA